jgi:hypothetical protein
MKVTRTVVLYGDSIVLASMAAVLMQQEDVLVQHIGANPDWGQAAEIEPRHHLIRPGCEHSR